MKAFQRERLRGVQLVTGVLIRLLRIESCERQSNGHLKVC